MPYSNVLKSTALIAALSLLTACGGGGGGDGDANDSSLFQVPDGMGGEQLVLDIGGEELIIDKDLVGADGTINDDLLPDGVTADELAAALEDELIGDASDVPALASTGNSDNHVNTAANPEPITATLGVLSLTAVGLACTRRRRRS